MKYNELELAPYNTARSSTFMELACRLKEEHDRLKVLIEGVCELSEQASSASKSMRVVPMLEQLRRKTEYLMLELKAHSDWEDRELFPVLTGYFKREITPTITPSLWVLEKDYELAMTFLEGFMTGSGQAIGLLLVDDRTYEPAIAEQFKQAADQLTQGCLILKGHFHMEEELIFPLADEILTDLDYLFA